MLLETLVPFIPDDFVWVFGLGLTLALSFLFVYITEGSAVHFLGWATFISGLCVWAALLPAFVFFAFFIGFITLIYFELREGGL